MSEQSATNWFVRIDGTEYGPFSEADLKRWAAQGHLPSDAEVRKGSGPWVTADLVRGLLPAEETGDAKSGKDRLAEIEAAIKARGSAKSRNMSKPSGKRSKDQRLTLLISGFAVLALLGSGFVYWYNLPQNREARAVGKISNGLRELAVANSSKSRSQSEPEPLKILSARYSDSFYESTTGSDAGCAFKIQVELKNISSKKTIENATYYTRTIKPGRKAREFQTINRFESIQGGINPGEVLSHDYIVRTEDVNGSQLLLHKLPPGTVLEVSTDGNTWVQAVYVGEPRILPEVSKQENDTLLNGM